MRVDASGGSPAVVQCRRGADRAIAVPSGIEEGPDSIGRDSG
ncbi:hypothetical protein BN940_16781 [Castellaniella defragrans 65Phen]|uniref:Uncharacterized protein n=1 Tax=Castellaniella defragrans (strain DSM 12143 / CCUG 39792 / 65Phen) TaxID=1437824 RepID=W8X1J0_CASD6|nr:hypothetical protein BN940_16781 [Castellaniella defragrans 65Phen]